MSDTRQECVLDCIVSAHSTRCICVNCWKMRTTSEPAECTAASSQSEGVIDHTPFKRVGEGADLYSDKESSGPGTELSNLLKRFGIEPTPTCQCRAKAAQMDAWGPDECERPERIEEVVAVMRAEAEARGLPFLDVAGRMLVRRAIKNARRKAKMD
jgi:hypothetical protein